MNSYKSLLGGLGVVLVGLTASAPAFAHEEARVAIESDAAASQQAGDVAVEFELLDLQDRVSLTDQNLSIVHEKRLHVFIFDSAFKEFRHEHPEFVGGKWRLTTNLPVNGRYWVWAQGEIASDRSEFSASMNIRVVGGLPANALPPVLGNVRRGTDGLSQVALSDGRIVAKRTVMLKLNFTRTNGSTPALTPFLGELAHVIGTTVLSDGDGVLVHSHPMNHGIPNELMLHAVFPFAGNYRLWVQFIDGGVLKTVPLSVVVAAQ